jgi:hypothetical protein
MASGRLSDPACSCVVARCRLWRCHGPRARTLCAPCGTPARCAGPIDQRGCRACPRRIAAAVGVRRAAAVVGGYCRRWPAAHGAARHRHAAVRSAARVPIVHNQGSQRPDGPRRHRRARPLPPRRRGLGTRAGLRSPAAGHRPAGSLRGSVLGVPGVPLRVRRNAKNSTDDRCRPTAWR